jgi:hypothetical protein
MKTLNEKIIENLQSKHDAFLGTKGEKQRQSFKKGLSWAIDCIESLTEIDRCENKEIPEGTITLTERVIKPLIKKIKLPKVQTSKVRKSNEGVD